MLRNITAAELREILQKHNDWLMGRPGGVRADLQSADLRYADLQSANLRYANLQSADLQSANLQSADLRYANLRFADLRYANLQSADLRYANLQSADLRSANLQSADLRYANLQSADLQSADLRSADAIPETVLTTTQIVPQYGAFFGYKKCRDGLVVLLEIPAKAGRVGGSVGRKCRASEAKVVAIYESKGKESRKKTAYSTHQPDFAYTVGKTVKPDSFDDNRAEECSNGIHFFITYEEAEAYQ